MEYWPRYYLADLSLSRQYDPAQGLPFEDVVLPGPGVDKPPPEHDYVACNPFPTDVYLVGDILKRGFLLPQAYSKRNALPVSSLHLEKQSHSALLCMVCARSWPRTVPHLPTSEIPWPARRRYDPHGPSLAPDDRRGPPPFRRAYAGLELVVPSPVSPSVIGTNELRSG